MNQLFRFLVFAFLFQFLLAPAGEAVYKVKKKEGLKTPVFQSAEEERFYRLDHGEVLTDGGYLEKGVWGRMEGVIEAPPELVWRLYIQANDWKRYQLPTLIDSRGVSPGVLERVGTSQHVEDFYRVGGGEFVDPTKERRRGAKWLNRTFQYYNVPWPVADRWFILKSENDETRSPEGFYKAEFKKVAGNVRTLDGTITFEVFRGNPKRTLMVYEVKSDPGSFVPKFLVRWGVRKTMPEAIRTIRREAARVQGF